MHGSFPKSSAAVPGSRYIPYTPVNGTWLHAAKDQPWLGYADPWRRDRRCDDARHGAGGHVDLKLGIYETVDQATAATKGRQ
jgi:hypothetical protein